MMTSDRRGRALRHKFIHELRTEVEWVEITANATVE